MILDQVDGKPTTLPRARCPGRRLFAPLHIPSRASRRSSDRRL